jgi:pimeloyl-ACP methyl ester carboxylesterase
MEQRARPYHSGRRATRVTGTTMRGLVPVLLLCLLAACAGAGAGRGGGHGASPGTAGGKTTKRLTPDVAPYAAQLRAATLFVTAQDDPFGAAAASEAYYRTAPAADKQLLVRPGMAHGTELLSDPVVHQAVLDFVASHDG